MMEFLFSSLITKVYKYNEFIYYFPREIKIMIEIPNGFIDFFAKFPLLDLFLKKHLSENKLASLTIPKDIKSNEQVIGNYLIALKNESIDKEDIYFPLITPTFNDTSKIKKLEKKHKYKCVEAKIIPEKECNDLILEAIKKYNKIENPNYYQIKTFINILGVQLKQFSQNELLSAFHILSLDQIVVQSTQLLR